MGARIYGGYNPLYDPEKHPAQFIELAKLGKTRAQIHAAMDISKQTHYDWMNAHPEYKAAVDLGIVHMQAKQEELLDDLSTGRVEGNATAQIFKMKMQFKDDYTDVRYIKQESSVSFNNLPDDQLEKMLAAKLKLLPEADRQSLLGTVIEGEYEEVSQE
jgi:hypothetical protein